MAERPQNERIIRETTGSYRFPRGGIGHVGPYGVNEQDPDIIRFENSREQVTRLRRKEEKTEAKRSRNRGRFALVALVIAALILGFGGSFLFAHGVRTAHAGKAAEEMEVVPVAAEAPAEPAEAEEAAPAEETVSAAEAAAEKNEESEAAAVSAAVNDDPSYTRVINRSYPIPENYIAGSGRLSSVEGIELESEAAKAMEQMLKGLRDTGMSIQLVSGYRSDDYQRGLYERQINKQGGNKEKAATISAVPMTSEHQAGLAADLSVDGTLETSFSQTEQGKWLEKHCMEYGYILRYPPGKEIVTGIIYEPWHFRYVGSPATASAIMSSGQTMEEYYGKTLKPEDIDAYRPYLNESY